MSDSKSAKSYIQCWGNRVYFSRPIVRVLIRQACWGKPSILFTLALPRVGFPIWGFPPSGLPGRQLRLTLSPVEAKSFGVFKIETVSQHVEAGQQEPTERLMSGYCCTFIVFSTLSSSTTYPCSVCLIDITFTILPHCFQRQILP